MRNGGGDYVGRYAPSPTGPLHLGSLLAALASYLDARSNSGQWLLRIDDLDTARVVPGADRAIIDTLSRFGLEHDGPVVYQSDRRKAYADAVRCLLAANAAFHCGCTRREAQTGPLGAEGPIYPGTCREGLPPGRASRSIRLRVDGCPVCLTDRIQGRFCQWLDTEIGDFVIRRADAIAAYQLATVVDDAWQGITDVVRGQDLLSSTPRQLWLADQLNVSRPAHAHMPLIVDRTGRKLGKSLGALALDTRDLAGQLWRCLDWLGQEPCVGLAEATPVELLDWAILHWSINNVPARQTLSFQD